MLKVKVTSKGQVTIPGALRKKLQIKEGDYLDASIQNGGLLLKPSPSQTSSEIIKDYCSTFNDQKADLEQTRRILSKVPFSLSERVSKLREE